MKDNILAACVVLGLLGFLYPIYERLGQMEAWGTFSPADARAVVLALMSGIAAIGCAMGLNLKQFISNMLGLGANVKQLLISSQSTGKE